jgi:O-acetyl-ADP-ribose deacetylase (regulator of RNase III)
MIHSPAEIDFSSKRHLLQRIKLVQGDILQQKVDAIVTTIPKTLELSGKLNQDMMEYTGNQLDEYILDNIYKPSPGDVFVVPGFNLPADWVIFSIVPNWRTEFDRTDRDLLRAYRGAMEEAVRQGFHRIAFPALVTGRKGFPITRAARLAVQGIMERINEAVVEVRIVCFNPDAEQPYRQRLEKYGWNNTSSLK